MTRDWIDMLECLQNAGARFMVVGAHALAVHGVPRGTQDLDIWIESSEMNARRVWEALLAFGAPVADLGLTIEDLQRPDTVLQLGLPPNRIDFLTSITGVPDFNAAWAGRVQHSVGPLVVPFLGRAALVETKRATGRHKDLADLEALGELTEQ